MKTTKHVILIIVIFNVFTQSIAQNLQYNVTLCRANTGKLRPLTPSNREFIKLMNLYRLDQDVLLAYVDNRYGEKTRDEVEKYVKQPNKVPATVLRPAFGLQKAALLHAISSGLNSYEGHRMLNERAALFANFSSLLPRNALGENCAYGYYSAINVFTQLLSSSGHNRNMLEPRYHRVGIGKFMHIEYRWNTVTVFGGRNILGHVTYALANKMIHFTRNSYYFTSYKQYKHYLYLQAKRSKSHSKK
jgi:hypothetical protein